MIDSERIFNCITSGNYPALVVEQGSELVDTWVSDCFEEDRKRYKTLLVEAGFFVELDETTFIVGACDRVMEDDRGVLVEESKSTSESRTWTVNRWFDSIFNSHQIGTYSVALYRGGFLKPTGDIWFPSVREPRILVRAVTKTKPPKIWPSAEGAEIKVPERIETTVNVYKNEAAAIRARRKTGLVPWQLPAKHCEKVYGNKTYFCDFFNECRGGKYPEVSQPLVNFVLNGLSPGSSSVVEYLISAGKINVDNHKDVVVLSASSLESAMQCPEKWRRHSLGQKRESKESLDIGSVLHLGLKSYHEQMKENGF